MYRLTEEKEMTKKEFLKLAEEVWEECNGAVERAPSGQVIRRTEGVFREKFLELARRTAEAAYQKRGDGHAFSPSVCVRPRSSKQGRTPETSGDDAS